ncbi:putative toxin-antitoxin system toxin component, PIN family [Rickettsiella grylli]|uniref:putative toxin-antitoxin system toxin component, PIN family n=1 Tax=Rickettsiella grylli TaxID=59196 RepID=UPI0009D7227A
MEIVSSLEILEEYSRVSDILSKKYPHVDLAPFINLIIKDSLLFKPIKLKTPVSRDPDDDKFIAVALAANCRIIISGDNDLLSITGYKDIEIINPNEFWKKYLK